MDTLRIFNRFTGAPIRDIPIPNPFAAPGTTPGIGTAGALFLNHVVVSNDGTAYISNQLNSAIFKVAPEGNTSVLAAGPQLGNPDGFLLDNGELSWGTFFTPAQGLAGLRVPNNSSNLSFITRGNRLQMLTVKRSAPTRH